MDTCGFSHYFVQKKVDMPVLIKCPNCGEQFDSDVAITADLEQKLQQQYQQKLQQSLQQIDADRQKMQEDIRQFEEKKKNQNEIFLQRMAQEKQKLTLELQESIQKTMMADFENKIRLLEEGKNDTEEKLKIARQKELDFLQKVQELTNKEQELELTLQRKLQDERERLTESIRKQEMEKNQLKENDYQLKLKEMQLQLEDQKKLAEEMRRKAEQGSMQMQGEVQEIALEEMLAASFPFDKIAPVGKGVRGADCIQIIHNKFGQECGKIIYESKRTKDFSEQWIEKLKADMRSQGTDLAVIVTQAMPKDMEQMGQKNGVWICSFAEVKPLATLLRESVLKLFAAIQSQENRGDKMSLLYNYLTGNEFAEQWKAIREGFMSMKISIQKERDAMEKLWKAREKQLEKVLLNAAHIRGSVEGISGIDAVDLNLLGDEDVKLLE
jgi:hypothetical protein